MILKKGKSDPHEVTLEKVYGKAKAALEKKPTGANVDAVAKTRKALDDYKTALAAKADPEARRFANPTEIHEYLEAEGWKVSQRKVYEDQGKIPKEKNGTYSKKEVDTYARLSLTRLDGSDLFEPGMADKINIEINIAKEKLKKITLENQIEAGKWVLKSEVEQKHTAKLALFLNAIDNFIYSGKIEEAVEMVKGDKDKAPDMKAFIKKEFRGLLGEYARRPEFTVSVKSMEEAAEMIKD